MPQGKKPHIAPSLLKHTRLVDQVVLDPANLKIHGEKSIAAIAASLARFGQQKPVVVDSKGVVIAGNGLLQAARSLGWKSIAVIESTLAGAERVGYAIADNRAAEFSEWDEEALAATLRTLTDDQLESVGYSAMELERLAGGLSQAEEDEAPKPLKAAVTRIGDLWRLGPHRILCGDSTKPDDVARIMDGKKACLVATDPPYLVDYTGDRPKVKDRKTTGKDWSDVYHEIDIKDADRFFRALFSNILTVLEDKAAIYCWHAHRRCGLIQQIWEELGILDHQQIVWVKPSSVFGRVYWHFQHEPCMMGWRKGSMPEHDNVHDHTSVWDCGWETPEGEEASKVRGNEHPTQKPVELFARPIRKHTAPGDIVFEPFSGSGTQLMAAEQTGRLCRAIEIEPVFVDVAIRRWQAATGKEAVLDSSGKAWKDVAKARKVDLGAALCQRNRSVRATTQAAPS